jgi:hypothetical protein
MVNLIPTVIKNFYDKWNIQSFILFSLSLQTILILFAPFRKRSGNIMVIWLIWSAYLLADWAANFAVGLISNSQGNSSKPNTREDILAFWAPFLLLHLGGPDTITAFALEDNALWLRHLVGLLTQVSAAVLVFGQALPENKYLWIPTVLLFVAGTIKFGERTRALFLANLNKFRESMLKPPDPGPNYAKIMEEYAAKKEAKLPTQIELIAEPNQDSKTARYAIDEGDRELDDLKTVKHAYHFFEIFKGLIVDLIFSFRERDESRLFFQKRKSKDAFKVLAVELNFMYEVLYTKVVVVHSKFGYFVRFISWCAVVAAFSIFYKLDKQGFRKIDVGITYTLLFGAIVLDTIALFMLAFSDWTAASIQNLSRENIWKTICKASIDRCFLPLLKYFLTLKKINWGTETSWLGRARQILFRRWSESLYQYNLIDYCLKERLIKGLIKRLWIYPIEELGLKDFYDLMKYVSKKPFAEELWEFIFDQLKKKSNLADDPDTAKRICSARGDWVLQDSDWNSDSSKLMSYVVDVDYDQSLMIWHIATDICYSTESGNINDDESTIASREFCKVLSDYMLYLLVMQPTMMSAVAGIGQIRFRDTCAEAKNFFKRKNPRGGSGEEHKQACEMILEVNTDVRPVDLKGDRSKSVLFDACILAKELKNLKGPKKWKLMSEVWVELLSYAASHCRANTHAAQLSKGGELITFVWLLMAHLGIGDQFQINEGHARAKLIVGK